uniref:hypothetical protein n=1 Tax=Promicromonospora sp. CA-289581 TaxID=3240013 RepID=UPI003F498D12
MGTTRTTTEVSTVGQEIQTVIDSLTTLATAQRTTSSGLPARYDFGEIVSRVLTTVAANVGGLDPLLSGSASTWSSRYIRQIVAGTWPVDALLSQRTAPVRLHLDVAGYFLEFGQAGAFEEEFSVVQVAVRDAVTPEEAEEARQLAGALSALYEADKETYRAAYERAVRDELTTRGLPADVPVEVIANAPGADGVDAWWDSLADELHMLAYERTPRPAALADPEFLGYTERATRRLAGQNAAQAAVVGEA